MRRLPLAAACLIAAGFLLAGCSLAADITPPPGYQAPTAAPASSSSSAYPLVAPDPSRASVTYAEKCAPCHGTGGKGDGAQAGNLPNPPPAIGSVEVARMASPASWYAVVTDGRIDQMMPGFSGSLSDSQRWDVVSYAFSLSQDNAALQRGEEVFAAECASCHAPGSPSDLASPAYAAAVSQAEIKAVIENGAGADMPAYASTLSEAEIWAVSAYIQSLSLGRLPAAVSQALTPQPEVAPTTGSPTPAGMQTPTPTASAEGGLGSISGQVINGSGGPVPQGLVVTLQGYDDMQEALILQTETGPDGRYLFEDVEMPAGRVFLASAEYGGSVFNSDIAHTSEGPAPLSLDLFIYDVSTETSGLQVDRMHVLLDFTTEGTVQVVEMFIISNPTSSVIQAESLGDPVVEYGLPEGAANLQFQDGEIGGRFVKTEAGFGDIQAIMPGMSAHQVLFGYDLPYSNALDLSIPLSMAVDAAVVMIPEGSVRLASNQLADSGTREAEGTVLHVYSAAGLPAGGSLDLEIRGRPGSAGTSLLDLSDTTGLAIGAAVFGLALLGAGAWMYFKRVRPQLAGAAAPVAGLASPSAPDDADSLIDAIIALDDQFRSGDIPEEAYRQRRADLKARLADAMKPTPDVEK